MRKIDLSYQKNVRDLVGLVGYQQKKVKENRIIRGGFLGRVSPKDIEVINSLHLTDIVDFRGEDEFVNRPDYRFEGVRYHNLPAMETDVRKEDSKTEDSNLLWFLGEEVNGYKHMFNLYPVIVTTEPGITAFKKFFELLVSKDNLTVYFHCSQGKDRAGLVAYLLEIALGVSPEVAREDYLATNEAMKIKIKQLKAQLRNELFYDSNYEKSLVDVFEAKEDYLDNALKAINEKYGSVENYLVEELEVDIEKLRALYLE